MAPKSSIIRTYGGTTNSPTSQPPKIPKNSTKTRIITFANGKIPTANNPTSPASTTHSPLPTSRCICYTPGNHTNAPTNAPTIPPTIVPTNNPACYATGGPTNMPTECEILRKKETCNEAQIPPFTNDESSGGYPTIASLPRTGHTYTSITDMDNPSNNKNILKNKQNQTKTYFNIDLIVILWMNQHYIGSKHHFLNLKISF